MTTASGFSTRPATYSGARLTRSKCGQKSPGELHLGDIRGFKSLSVAGESKAWD
jgi:hypothetical protein